MDFITPEMQQEVIDFTQSLIRIKSYSGQEEEIIKFIEQKMKALGYDDVTIDSMGNLLGRIGNGKKSILFDLHVDTVAVNDETEWDNPPFSGDIVDGRLHGRGSVDMKSSVAASVYAGAIAKKLGFDSGKTVYASCTVFEEDCDGENLRHLFKELNLMPDYVVICEPSNNKIALGHKGKAQISIKTQGISAHGSAPEKGVNAIYEMAEIIQRVEQVNAELMKQDAPRGTPVPARPSTLSLQSVRSIWIEEQYLARRKTPSKGKWTSSFRVRTRPGKWERFIEKAGRGWILSTSRSILPGKLT